MAQHVRGAAGPTTPAATRRSGGQPLAQRLGPDPAAPGQAGSWRSLGSIGASGSDQSSPNWWRTSASHQSISSSAPLIAGTSRAFGPRPRLPLPWRTCSLPNPPRSGRQSRMSSITVSLIRSPSRRHSDAAK